MKKSKKSAAIEKSNSVDCLIDGPKRNPCICNKCGHNMGRSHVKATKDGLQVRCYKCKTLHSVRIVLPCKEGKVTVNL